MLNFVNNFLPRLFGFQNPDQICPSCGQMITEGVQCSCTSKDSKKNSKKSKKKSKGYGKKNLVLLPLFLLLSYTKGQAQVTRPFVETQGYAIAVSSYTNPDNVGDSLIIDYSYPGAVSDTLILTAPGSFLSSYLAEDMRGEPWFVCKTIDRRGFLSFTFFRRTRSGEIINNVLKTSQKWQF